MRRGNLALEAAAMLAVSAAGRSILRHTESRWQIVAWCVAAVLLEIGSREDRPALRIVRPALLCGAAVLGVLAVKAVLEPYDIHVETRTVRAKAGAVVRAMEHRH